MNLQRYYQTANLTMDPSDNGAWVKANEAGLEIKSLECQVAELEKRLHYAQKILEKIKLFADDTF